MHFEGFADFSLVCQSEKPGVSQLLKWLCVSVANRSIGKPPADKRQTRQCEATLKFSV